MAKKIRISWVQIMALLALFGILLGVVGTAWIGFIPVVQSTVPPSISGEINGQ